MADYILDEDSIKIARRVIKARKEFHYIDPKDVLIVRNITADHSKFYARTSLIPTKLRPVLKYKILIETCDCNFGRLPKNNRRWVIYHELKHVGEHNSIEGEYKLIHHDVEDFAEMINNFGLNWAQRKDLPDMFNE